MTSAQKIITSIIIIIILIGGYLLVVRKHTTTETPGNTASTTDSTASTTTTTINGVTVTGPAGYTVEQVGDLPAHPDLDRKLSFDASLNLSADDKAAIASKAAGFQSALKKDPTSISDWMNLGLYQKAAGDYAGAALSWKYVAQISKDDFVALGDLGNLYAYYLKDGNAAENYYTQAIGRSSTQAYLYVQLGEVYRDVFKDAAKAKAIADQGLSKISNDPAILQFKATLN